MGSSLALILTFYVPLGSHDVFVRIHGLNIAKLILIALVKPLIAFMRKVTQGWLKEFPRKS